MEISNPKLVYSIIAAVALVTVSIVTVGLYSGFPDDLDSNASAQENVTVPAQDDVVAAPGEIKN